MEQSKRALRMELAGFTLIAISSTACWIYSFENMTFSLLFLDGVYVSGILLAILRRVSLAEMIIIASAIELPIVILASLEIVPSIVLFLGIISLVYISRRLISRGSKAGSLAEK